MSRHYRVISGDGHVETPPEVWLSHVPAEHRDRAPRLIQLPEGGDAARLSGASFTTPDGAAVWRTAWPK